MATRRSCSLFGRKVRLAGGMGYLQHVPQACFMVWRELPPAGGVASTNIAGALLLVIAKVIPSGPE